MHLMRVKEQEVKVRDDEIKRLKSNYEEHIKMLQTTLESKQREERDMKILHEKVDKFAALIPLKNDCQKIMEKVDKVAALEAEITELKALSQENDVYIGRLKMQNSEFRHLIQHYEHSQYALEAENAQLKGQFSHLMHSSECPRPECVVKEQEMREQQKILSAECTRKECVKRGQRLKDQEKMLNYICSSAVCQRRECVAREQKLKDQEELLCSAKCMKPQCVQTEQQMIEQQKELLSAECTKPGCAAMEHQMKEQQKKIMMFSPMKEMAVQFEGQHDQLKKEYNELMTDSNLPAILGQLEKTFTDPFNSKVVLTKILMVAYKECKRVVIQSVTQHIEELFTVQSGAYEESGEPSDVDMEDLSRAYGLLLQATASKTRLACTTAMQEICGKIKSELKTVEQLQSKTWERKMKKLPLEKVVELAWKFVTQNNPLIVCQPETFHEDVQERDYYHWKPKIPKPYTLTYARPVLYRSYHGIIAGTGLVGNIPLKESSF